MMEIGNVENVCRLCLSVNEPRSSVFAQDREEDPSGVSLAAKIQACLSIQVSLGSAEENSSSSSSCEVDSHGITGEEDRSLGGRVSSSA